MPRKKIRKEKTREYLEKLLDDAGVSDQDIAIAIKSGLKSVDATERKNALAMAAKMRGFADVDKKVGEDIEALPIQNIKLEDMERLANRCPLCKHGGFVPMNTPTQDAPGLPDGAPAAADAAGEAEAGLPAPEPAPQQDPGETEGEEEDDDAEEALK
jgi:hypothetical protein